MPLRLSATFVGKPVEWVLPATPARIGSADRADVRLHDASVEPVHAELRVYGGRWTVRDLATRQGTRVNGREAFAPRTLVEGDRIEVGAVMLAVDESTWFSRPASSSSEVRDPDPLPGWDEPHPRELAAAARIQRALLPVPPDLPGWTCHARLETCHEVGGDLFDFHMRDDGTLVLLVGDVSGKGMGAALLMSSTLSTARVLYDACAGPLDLVRRLNETLGRDTDSRAFVTLFVGWLDPANGHMRYVNAGHPDAHIIRGGSVRKLGATGIPVAMTREFPWTEDSTVVEHGETLVLSSDGLDEGFDEPERVAEVLREAAAERGLDRVAAKVLATLDASTGRSAVEDDVTLVLLRRD